MTIDFVTDPIYLRGLSRKCAGYFTIVFFFSQIETSNNVLACLREVSEPGSCGTPLAP